MQYDFVAVIGISNSNPAGVLQSTEHIVLCKPDDAQLDYTCIQLLTLPNGRPVFFKFAESAGKQQICLTELPGFDILENTDVREHFCELGYSIILEGGSTSHINITVDNALDTI